MIARLLTRGFALSPLIEARTAQSDSTIKGTTWVLTGALSQPRDEIAEIIISRGGKVSASVSKKTSFVLAGERCREQTREGKEALGSAWLTEAGLRKML